MKADAVEDSHPPSIGEIDIFSPLAWDPGRDVKERKRGPTTGSSHPSPPREERVVVVAAELTAWKWWEES